MRNYDKWDNAIEITDKLLPSVRVMVEKGTGSIWVEDDRPEGAEVSERDEWVLETLIKDAEEASWEEESW